jgi:hypothetical protein
VTIHDVMNQERAALLGESLIKDPISGLDYMPYAAVTEPNVLVRTPRFLRAMHPVNIESLFGRDRGTAFIQVCPSLQYKFLWVHAENNDYRRDYGVFLRDVHKVQGDLPKEIHVDHLYNRSRARQFETPFIRLVLMPQAVNTSHGAGYEKSRGRSGLGREGRDHKMDELTLMKLCGVPSPKKGQPPTAEMVAHMRDVARLYRMSFAEIERVIKELMEVASFEAKGL